MNLIESIAFHLVVDHIVALMQTRQVGFRVQDGAEAMIGAVRRFLKDRDKQAIDARLIFRTRTAQPTGLLC